MLKNIYAYRGFILQSVRNDLISRFIRSKLGAAWAILNPLSQVLIYALILSSVLSAKLPGITHQYAYAVYLMAGLLGWSLFSEIVSRCLNVFIDHGEIIKKTDFPKATLPVIVVVSCLASNFLLFVCVLIIFAFFGHSFNESILYLFPLTLAIVVLSLGIGVILGVMNVFLRDIGQVTPIILQVLFWFTPIVYPITIIPENYRHWLELNPVYPIIDAYQQVLVYGKDPSMEGLAVVFIFGVVLSVVGFFMFRRASSEIMDVL